MKRVLKPVLALGAVLLALFIAAGLLIRMLLISDHTRQALLAALSKTARVGAEADSVRFRLPAWFLLRPSLALENVVLGNPEGFGSASLLEAAGMEVQVRLLPLLIRRVEIDSIRIDRPRVTIERNPLGATNLEVFLRNLQETPSTPVDPSAPSGPESTFAVRSIRITNGSVRFAASDPSRPRPATAVDAIRVELRDLARDQPCLLEAEARLFQGEQSRLTIEGTAGPFTAASIPIDGKAWILLAPAEIPPAIREEQIGDLLANPGSEARLALEISAKGDLYGSLDGPAKLTFTDLRAGRDARHLLPLAGDASAQFSIHRPLSTPVIELKIGGAELRLGSGHWKGSLEIRSEGGVTRGLSKGQVRGVDVNEFLSSFTSAGDKVFGHFELPAYSLSFEGRDAAGLRSSLAGSGRLEITKGRLQALDLMASIQRAIRYPRQDPTDTAGITEFLSLEANWTIGQQAITFSDLLLESPVTRIGGEGRIGFDQSLDFRLAALISGRMAVLLGGKAEGGQPARASVPIKITGAVGKPKVRPDTARLAVGRGLTYLERLLENRLGKQ